MPYAISACVSSSATTAVSRNNLSTPCMACSIETGSSRSPIATSTAAGSLPSPGCLRASTRTFAFRLRSSVTTVPPTFPVPPITRIFMAEQSPSTPIYAPRGRFYQRCLQTWIAWMQHCWYVQPGAHPFMNDLDLNDVRTFVAVSQAGTLTAAAKELRLPTSTVSRALTRLEKHLGVLLVQRSPRGLVL